VRTSGCETSTSASALAPTRARPSPDAVREYYGILSAINENAVERSQAMGGGADLVIHGMKGVNILPAPGWFVAINPAKRIPVLRDRSLGAKGLAGTIPDSSARPPRSRTSPSGRGS
jgi:hypothetical protein